ncbi:hypothetical protein BH09SUM1_BH09SUM1_09520 [soil metagenome]
MTEEEQARWKFNYESLATEYTKRFAFCGDRFIDQIDLFEYFIIKKPGLFQFRVGYIVYPETGRDNFAAPLLHYEVIWSEVFTLHIIPEAG